MKGCLMNHFKCPYDPFACGYSVFFEDVVESNKIKRKWVECADYQIVENPVTKKMIWTECESFTLVVDSIEIMIKKGDLCVNNPDDWWGEYKDLQKV